MWCWMTSCQYGNYHGAALTLRDYYNNRMVMMICGRVKVQRLLVWGKTFQHLLQTHINYMVSECFNVKLPRVSHTYTFLMLSALPLNDDCFTHNQIMSSCITESKKYKNVKTLNKRSQQIKVNFVLVFI